MPNPIESHPGYRASPTRDMNTYEETLNMVATDAAESAPAPASETPRVDEYLRTAPPEIDEDGIHQTSYVHKDFARTLERANGIAVECLKKANAENAFLRAEVWRLRQCLNDLKEHVSMIRMEFDDGDVMAGDFIDRALTQTS